MVSTTCVFLCVVAFLTVVKRPVLALRPILILVIYVTSFHGQWPARKGMHARCDDESPDQVVILITTLGPVQLALAFVNDSTRLLLRRARLRQPADR